MTDGPIIWSGPTIHPPPGHGIISAGKIWNGRFLFSVGVEHDPQSDAFNGIWDNVSSSEVFNIEGKGEVIVSGATISGNFTGVFAHYWWRHGNGVQKGVWCIADDHRFDFIEQ